MPDLHDESRAAKTCLLRLLSYQKKIGRQCPTNASFGMALVIRYNLKTADYKSIVAVILKG